jgi:hypothetical protein
MPFDGLPQNDGDVLRRARNLIADGWITRAYYDREKQGYCAIGALARALGIFISVETIDMNLWIIDPYAQLLLNELNLFQRFYWWSRTTNQTGRLIAFNDRRTKQHVLTLFDRAIARQACTINN